MVEIQTPIGGPGMGSVGSASKIGLIIKIAVGVVGGAIVVTGGLLTTRVWDPLWSPLRPEPEEVIKEMFSKMKEVETMRSEVKVEVGVIDEKVKQEVYYSLAVNDDSDTADSDDPRSAGSFDFVFRSDGMQISVGGEYKIVEGEYFVKIDKIPPIPELGMDLNIIKGEWIKLPEDINEDIKGNGEREPLKEKIMEAFEEEEIYSIKEELPDEKIDGRKAYHYLLVMDKEDMKKIDELAEKANKEADMLSYITSTSNRIPVRTFPGASEIPGGGIIETPEGVEELEFEVWIGKKDNLLYKVKLDKEIDAADIEKSAEGKTTIAIDIAFSMFNESMKIKAPEESKTLEEILGGSFISSPVLPSIDR